MVKQLKLSVSACLLGEEVRFDGGHKRFDFVVDGLSKYATFVPFCPEHVAFGTPRESVKMIKNEDEFHIITNNTHLNLTYKLEDACIRELQKLKKEDVDGIILKSKSPTCGLGSSKVYLENGDLVGNGNGVFAEILKREFEGLPIEEDGRLNDPWIRENFVMHFFAYRAFKGFKLNNSGMKDLIRFHQKAKIMLLSKNETLYRKLGHIVANHKRRPFEEVLREYEYYYKKAIAMKSRISKAKNVLMHMMGFIKDF